ncbi:MAG: DUF6311 domain-containing protein [Lachnospiraceae bacterium]|nr:DUF6311 domain-containing protein [Lachnospiraceae bacterium]
MICAAIGMLCFIGIYGVKVLDFTNVGWLFDNDHDLRQHFIAWCRYRSDPWTFPIGLIESLSWPNKMSVIYTDSIPVFAVIFKILGPALPKTFQYFGLFGLVSFMLTGGFAAILLRRFVSSDISCMIGSVFYIISSTIIHRMYYHTALAAQWIVIAALVLWVYDDLIASDRRRIIYWGLMGFICVGIHSYFLPMAGMILAASVLMQYFRKKIILTGIFEFVSFSAAGLFNLFILGAFTGGTSPTGFGLGTFNSNLNTFINPWEIGKLLPRLPLSNYFQYEGMAYLGAGILLLFVVVALGMVFRMVRKVPEEAFHQDAVIGRVTAALVVFSFVFAVLPNISFNDVQILWIPYPQIVEKILGIFRSNGRLIWPAMYILMTAAISFTAYTFRRYVYVGVIVLAGALMLQITDFSDAFAQRHELYTADHPTYTPWDDPLLAGYTDGKSEFIFLYTDNDLTMPTAYYGYFHDMKQNNYYFARDIEEKVREGIEKYYTELSEGIVRNDAVYVMRMEDYENARDLIDRLDVDMTQMFDHVIFVKR